MGFKKKFFKNTLTLAVYNYSIQFIEFFSTYILSRLLLPEEYGFVALISVFTGFISIFIDAGLSYAIIRSDYGHRYYKAISNLSILIGVLLFTVMAMLAYPICLFYKNMDLFWPTIVMSITFIIRSVSIVPSAILNKNLKFNKTGLIRFIGTLLQIIITIGLAYLGFSYWSLIISAIINSLFTNIMYRIASHFKFRIFPLVYLRLGFRTTRSLMANITGFNLIVYWARNLDNLIIGKYYGTAELGIYNRAYKLLYMALNSSSNLFGQVLFPSLKELKTNGGDVKKEFSSMLGIISLVSFPIGAFMILAAKPFVQFMWGSNWMGVADLLPFFGIVILMQTILSPVGNIYVLYEKERILFIIGGISAALLIAAIIAGAFFSIKHIACLYALSNIIFNVPLNMYLGFIRALQFKIKEVHIFWLPKVVLSLFLVYFVWNDFYLFTLITVAVYMIHILTLQWNDLKKFYTILHAKFKPS